MRSEDPFDHGEKQTVTGAHWSSKAILHRPSRNREQAQLGSQHRYRRAAGETTKLSKSHKIFQGKLA